MSRYIILGTAGHIDHGKSALVKALTGTDPDRLKEEKERGITIDLGFADLEYPDGLKVGIVDVPGHERLIKNMLAGAGGIDIVLMVIAADEGIMPQSREHLDICNLLRVKHGIVAITKSDLAEPDWIELVQEEVREFVTGTFLEGADMVQVSSRTGEGIDDLKEKIRQLAMAIKPRSEYGIFRLPVDRIFTLKGFGTVVTGTAISGSISIDKNVEILPSGIRTRVRGLQSHGRDIKTARAGQRVAINLQGVAKEDIRRGDVVTIPDKLKSTRLLDADIELLKDSPIPSLKTSSLVHFHTGTAELTARVVLYDRNEIRPGEKAFCQYRFKEPITVMAGDRYIIRRFSPTITIGGGEILDVSPRRRRREIRLKDLAVLEKGDTADKLSVKIFQNGINGTTLAELLGWIKIDQPELERGIMRLEKDGVLMRAGGRLIHGDTYESFRDDVIARVDAFHKANPLRPGMTREELRAGFRGVDQKMFEHLIEQIDELVVEREIVRLKSFKIKLGEDKQALKDRILSLLDRSGFQPLNRDELAREIRVSPRETAELLRIMASEKTLIRINDSIYIPANKHELMLGRLKEFFSSKSEMTVAEFRDMLGTSRKYALPFLEYLDSNKITLRVGEVRKLLKK
jgi:selenocysteine-specific elongation factor